MKKVIFIFAIILTALTSCEKEEEEEVTLAYKENTNTLTAEQQKMRNALETTTNVLLDMISNDPAYFDELNKVIVAGSPEYLEDRVMLKDLFSKTSNSSALRVKANSNKFTSDFKAAYNRNNPQKIGGLNNSNIDSFTNSDSLIQFLTYNNFSLYCPYPLENYDEDNRIPAITFHPIDNDSVNIGYVLKKNGTIEKVVISQAYNELHPVWILMPNETIESKEKLNTPQHKETTGYEVSIAKIYCKQYYGGIFSGDLDMRIVRMNSSAITYIPATNSYTGSILTDLSFKLPRKYVTDARNNYWKGWYNLHLVWDTNWDVNKNSNMILIYEWDVKGTSKSSIDAHMYDADGKSTGKIGTFESTVQSQDAIIGLNEWSRYWFLDIINNGNPNWYWTHDAGSKIYKIDGNNLIKISTDFYMTMQIREY